MIFIGCEGRKSAIAVKEKEIRSYPGVYEVDSVTNIQTYFDSLYHQCGADIWTHNPEDGESVAVWNAVRGLHRYVNQERKYYPAEEVKDALKSMAFEQGYIYSHSGSDSVNAGEVFMFRFLEQAAIHSPQLDFITDFHAEDGEAGILYYPEWCSFNPLYSFLVFKTKQGYKVVTVGQKGDAKINRIFKLQDNSGHIYYLCSNNDDIIYFRQYLYGWDGETMTLLCNGESVNWDREDNEYKIIFNPDKLTWDYCLQINGVFQKAEGTKTYKLYLEWDKSVIKEE